ncbi:unnamed protein product [Miscanthus lutarioriparius]|uniref:Uncharacterized protein n=1 Tax=Miscanthus lutarioriparius TaxID=422564 RepID=A0A811MZ87_9POAL|nr:unnamed protein product [Miscanthus lutarioriparius]
MAAGAAYGGGAGPFIFWFNGDRFNAGIFSRPATLSSSSIAVGASSLTVGFFQRIPFSIFLSSVKTRRSKATRLNQIERVRRGGAPDGGDILQHQHHLRLRLGVHSGPHLQHPGQQAPYGVCSGILQASDAEDKENVCPENNTDWLHKNYNYVRTRQPTSHTSCVPNSLTSHNLFNAMATPVTSSNSQRALAKRERYNNMNEHDKENMLQRKRDYKKKMRTQSAGDLAKETLHTVQNDIEYDGALFEPITNQSDEEDHMEAPRAFDIDDLLDDEETRQYIGEDGAFESYRVSVNGVDLNNNEDPYDYVYQNLSDRHHVLRKVPNCLYCGARRFQYESPGF